MLRLFFIHTTITSLHKNKSFKYEISKNECLLVSRITQSANFGRTSVCGCAAPTVDWRRHFRIATFVSPYLRSAFCFPVANHRNLKNERRNEKLVKQTYFPDLTRHTGSNRTVGMAHRGSSKYWETSNSNVCWSLQKTWFNISVY